MASSNQSRQLTDDNGFVQPWSNHLGINKEPHMSQWKHTDTPNVGWQRFGKVLQLKISKTKWL